MFKVPMEVLNYNRQQKGFVSYDFGQRKASTYSSLTDSSLAKFVEVEEELSDTDSIFGKEGLDASLNISLAFELTWHLIVALMAVLRGSHKFDFVADS